MNKNIQVRVRDVIEIDAQGNALCSRIYTFTNHADRQQSLGRFLDVSLPGKVMVDQIYFKSGAAAEFSQHRGPYEFVCKVVVEGRVLGPQGTITLTVVYRWPHFLPGPSAPSYEVALQVMQDFKFDYELEVGCADPGLIGSPSFDLQPEEYRLKDRWFVPTAEGTRIVRAENIPPRALLTVSIFSGEEPRPLPVLTALGEEQATAAPFRNVAVLFVQHLLTDFLTLAATFKRAGLRSENTIFVGIPYSTKQHVALGLRASNGRVIARQTYPFADDVRTALNSIFGLCQQRNMRFLVVEDGGYVASLLRNRDAVDPPWQTLCLGIVEQTMNGIKVSTEWQEHPKLYPNPVTVGVVDVARSPLKLQGESPLVGRAVVFNLKLLLSKYEHHDFHEHLGVPCKRALLIGCGNTGSEVAKCLMAEGCDLTIVDEKRQEELQAFPAGATYRPMSELGEAVVGQDIIVGCTGRAAGNPTPTSRPPMDKESHFLALKEDVVLVNASSKMCEFNWDAVDNVTSRRNARRAFGHERTLVNGKKLRVAADGGPVNFYNSESIPAERIQTVLGMLFVGACYVLQNKIVAGVNEFPRSEQDRILALYQRDSKG